MRCGINNYAHVILPVNDFIFMTRVICLSRECHEEKLHLNAALYWQTHHIATTTDKLMTCQRCETQFLEGHSPVEFSFNMN